MKIEGDLGIEDQNEVWAKNVAAAQAFLWVSGQWRMTALASGGVYWGGLDYTAAKAGLEMAGIEITKELWADVRVIEQGAKAAKNGD